VRRSDERRGGFVIDNLTSVWRGVNIALGLLDNELLGFPTTNGGVTKHPIARCPNLNFLKFLLGLITH